MLIQTDGSGQHIPRRTGGYAYRFIYLDQSDVQVIEDWIPAGFTGAAIGEMELYAVIDSLEKAWRHPFRDRFKQIRSCATRCHWLGLLKADRCLIINVKMPDLKPRKPLWEQEWGQGFIFLLILISSLIMVFLSVTRLPTKTALKFIFPRELDINIPLTDRDSAGIDFKHANPVPSCMIFKRLFIFLFLGLIPFSSFAENASERGLFVSVIENPPVLTDRDAMLEMIAFAKKAGIKKLFVQTYREGKAWFPSAIGDSAPYQNAFEKVGEDPLALLIREAHIAELEVHAWINLLSLGVNADAPILKKYGREILTRNKEDKKEITDYLIDNQYWLEPGDLRVRSELAKLIVEIVTAYPDLDGIQFDYIRYPDTKPAYGYTMENLKRFARATELVSFNEKTEAWRKWKRNQVTETVKLLVARARSINPKIQVSTTGCAPYVRAREEAFQDWGEWVNHGYVDFVVMMNYPDDLDEFKKYVEGAKKKVNDFGKVYLAVGTYKFLENPSGFDGIWAACEQDFSRGCVIFYYGNLIESPELKETFFALPRQAPEPVEGLLEPENTVPQHRLTMPEPQDLS